MRWRTRRVPRRGASSSAAGETENVPLPSEDHCHASSLPARRENTSTRSATMKRRIEADAELADQRRAFPALGGFDAIEERLGSGMRDGPESLHQFLAAHADAVVFDREAFVVGIDQERDAQGWVIAEQFRAGDRLVTQ